MCLNKKEFSLHCVILGFVFGSGIGGVIVTKDWSILLVLALTVLYGVAAWLVSDFTASRTTRFFFYLQKFSWLHFRLKPDLLKDENYFLSKAKKNPTNSLFLLWIGSWALVVFMAYNIVFSLGITLPIEDNQISKNFDVLILAWILTPIVAFLVIPVSVIESSNLRLFLKSKKIIISPATPFRYLIGGFATINILITVLGELDTAELIAGLLYLPAPFYIMTFLYRFRSEKHLIADFRSYLKSKGIIEKKVNVS